MSSKKLNGHGLNESTATAATNLSILTLQKLVYKLLNKKQKIPIQFLNHNKSLQEVFKPQCPKKLQSHNYSSIFFFFWEKSFSVPTNFS
jgi:hypothetical protein